MGLTGPWFFVTLVAAAAGAVAGAVLLWPRIPGARLARTAARVGLIVLCQATAVLIVMVGINNKFGFYASWDDLLGQANTGGKGQASTAARARTTPPTEAELTVAFGSYGQGFQRATVHGARSGASGDVLVWTPPQYDERAYAHTRFPVIEVLHGLPGTPQSFLRGFRLGHLMEQQITAGRAEPAILVLPTITPGRVDTGCADVPGKGQVGTWLAHDVPEVVEHNFRALPAPHGWAVMGISTGGYCAARLVLEYPRRFTAAAALAPDNPSQGGERSPLWLAGNRRPDVDLLVGSSLQDRESPPHFAGQLKDAVRPPTTVTTLCLDTGGHNWNTWGRMFPEALTWVSARLEAPRTVPLATPAPSASAPSASARGPVSSAAPAAP